MFKIKFFLLAAMCWMALAAGAQVKPSGKVCDNLNGRALFGDLNNDGEVNLADVNVLFDVILTGNFHDDEDLTPNTTIAEFKARHWQDAVNYVDTVTQDEVIHGWVVANDVSGNIYKTLYIMDESQTGLAISINQTNLYQNFALGQEIILPMKGYWVGKYNSMQVLGYPSWYEQGQVWEANFMPQDVWASLAVPNGAPDASRVVPLEVEISDFAGRTDAETLRRYQGELVTIKGVTFVDADGTATYSLPNSSTNRTVMDDNGNTFIVRNSNYSDFKDEVLPTGKVDITGVLTTYGRNHVWQLYLRDINDVVSGGQGTSGNPYTVLDAIAAQNTGAKGWVSGYIVGAVAPEVTAISGNADIEWKSPTTLDNTIVIADYPDCTDINNCIIVPLAQGSNAREELNLKSNPALYKQPVKVKGPFVTYMGKAGLTPLEDYQRPEVMPLVLEEGFDAALPDNWLNLIVSGDKCWYHASYQNNGYAAVTGYKGTNPPFDAWLITPGLDIKNAASRTLSFRTEVNGYGSTTSKFEVYVLNAQDPALATVKVKLNPQLATAPASGYSNWVESGDLDLSQWADGGIYYIGFRYQAAPDTNYATWCLDDVKFGE